MTPEEPCCDSWTAAFEDGTDPEGYGPLIIGKWTLSTGYTIGGHPHPVRFCPWCGRPKSVEERTAPNTGSQEGESP